MKVIPGKSGISRVGSAFYQTGPGEASQMRRTRFEIAVWISEWAFHVIRLHGATVCSLSQREREMRVLGTH
jgi:hypothetical protein